MPWQKAPEPQTRGAEQILIDIRSSSGAYRRGLAIGPVALVPLIPVIVFNANANANGSGVARATGWSIVGLGVVIGLVAIGRMVTRVQLTPSSIRVRRLIGTEKEIARQQVACGILVQQYEQYPDLLAPLLILLDGSRRKLLHLSGHVYGAADINGFAERMGIGHFDVMAGPVTATLIDQRHPEVLSIWERRPFMIAFAVTGAVFVVVILLGIAQYVWS